MKASIVIPAHNRRDLLERAINSILKCNGSEYVEIIVVDDYSEPKLFTTLLRENDQYIRLPSKSGAAIARNVGMNLARGDIIYLLDSDDYVVERDFLAEYALIKDSQKVWFSNIKSQGYESKFPNKITSDDYFDYIFYKYPHITQTSSLCFEKNLGIMFDESLPKHQDWDFIYFSVLLKGFELKNINSSIFFDRGDKSSLSRKYNPIISDVWFNKLERLCDDISTPMINYYLYSKYPSRFGVLKFYSFSIKLILKRKLTIKGFLTICFHRLNQGSL